MAKVWKDRVAETTATTGTGTITGAGAVAQHQDLAEIGTGNTCDYCLLSGNGTDWETGQGTVTVSGSPETRTLSRDVIYESSNAGAAISLTGTSTVFCTLTARRAAQPFDNTGIPTSSNTGFTTWRNQGTASIADYGDGVRMTVPGTAGDNLRLRTKAAPSTPYAIRATVAMEATHQNHQLVFLGWDDGTKIHTISIANHSTNGAECSMEVSRWNSVSSFNSLDAGAFPGRLPIAIFELRHDGTTISFREYRWGNPNPVTHYSVATASGFLANYNTICWGGNRINTTGITTAYANLLKYEEIPG